jgi:hypothetical protein
VPGTGAANQFLFNFDPVDYLPARGRARANNSYVSKLKNLAKRNAMAGAPQI